MRAACRLSQLHTTPTIRSSIYRPGLLTGVPLRAATAKQRTGRSNLVAVTFICREESLQAAIGSKVTKVLNYADGTAAFSTASAAKRRKLTQQPGPANRVGLADGTGDSNTSGINSSTSDISDSSGIKSHDSSSGSSRRLAHASTNVISRSRQLDALESFLGYTFRDLRWLEQACTHDLTGDQPSYRELAFVGDAALWLLFAEHAFKAYGSLEDPVSGAWPAHLSSLLSRANCAATARQWGLDAYLQHSIPQHGMPQHSTPQHSMPQHSIPPHAIGPAESWGLQEPSGLADETQLTSAGLVQVWTDSQDDNSSSSSSSSWGDVEALSRTSSDASSSSSSVRSSTLQRRSGTYAGAWTNDTLAEMFEGVVGALLLDCGYDYETLKQLLLPWVASSLGASRQAGAASMLSTAAVLQPAAAAVVQPAAASPGGIVQAMQHQHSQELQTALLQQLQEVCGIDFSSHDPVKAASQHMMRVMTSGVCSAEAETLKFLGFSILQFSAALQAYRLQHQIGRESSSAALQAYRLQEKGRECSTTNRLWPAQLQARGREPSSIHRLWPAHLQDKCWHLTDSRGGSAAIAAGSSSSSSSSSTAGRSCGAGHRSNVVQQMSEHAGELTTVRHRAKMWLLLLEGTSWCPADSYLTNSNWKKQKQALARCLDLLLAAVYLDSGLEAAVGVAALLIHTTPLTTHDKSWMPAWARQNSKAVAALR